MTSKKEMVKMPVPLCVDLDGTLIQSDSLLESLLILLKRNPFYIFLTVYWLFLGKAYLKDQVSKRVLLNPSTLPYSIDLLAYLKNEFAEGRQLILVTGAHIKIAEAIAHHLGIFSHVFASDQHNNLIGSKKTQLLTQHLGEKQFDYAGNDTIDLKVWISARQAIVVNATAKLTNQVKQITTIEKTFPRSKNRFVTFLKAIRIHQYVKNALIFVPLFTSQMYTHIETLTQSLTAFLAFCFIASSVYLINDLVDLDLDRLHRTKYKRPFAAGDLSIGAGFISIILFTLVAFTLAALLNPIFSCLLLSYLILTQLYTFYFKKKHLFDVLFLGLFYVIRIVAGIAAIGSDYSIWLILFALFFFLSLAFTKRYTEVYLSKQENKHHILGRGYNTNDLQHLGILGLCCACTSVFVFGFYACSYKASLLYTHLEWLWLVGVLLFFWMARMWRLTIKGMMNEDPVAFAIQDKISLLTLATIVFMLLKAT